MAVYSFIIKVKLYTAFSNRYKRQMGRKTVAFGVAPGLAIVLAGPKALKRRKSSDSPRRIRI